MRDRECMSAAIGTHALSRCPISYQATPARPPQDGGQMRTYTLAFSILVHLLVVGVLVVTPLVATDDLPEPRRPVDFIEVVAPPTPTLPPPASSGSPRSESTNPHAAPLEAPDTIAPEPPGEP